VRIVGADDWSQVGIVLYRGGWADLNALTDSEVTTECPQIATPEMFGAVLDAATARLLGTGRPATA
jgi:hypothetical protein